MSAKAGAPTLRVIDANASEEEIAAIVAAVTASFASAGAGAAEDADHLDEWVRGARLVSRRVGRVRGPWRFSGRVARRTRP